MKLTLKDLIKFCKVHEALVLEHVLEKGYDYKVYDENYKNLIGEIDYETFMSMNENFEMVAHFGQVCKVVLK